MMIKSCFQKLNYGSCWPSCHINSIAISFSILTSLCSVEFFARPNPKHVFHWHLPGSNRRETVWHSSPSRMSLIQGFLGPIILATFERWQSLITGAMGPHGNQRLASPEYLFFSPMKTYSPNVSVEINQIKRKSEARLKYANRAIDTVVRGKSAAFFISLCQYVHNLCPSRCANLKIGSCIIFHRETELSPIRVMLVVLYLLLIFWHLVHCQFRGASWRWFWSLWVASFPSSRG